MIILLDIEFLNIVNLQRNEQLIEFTLRQNKILSYLVCDTSSLNVVLMDFR